ncbi:MAG: hypothetical protein RI963_1525 [Planctomycetota bacterium]|jgi:hypothetical protein
MVQDEEASVIGITRQVAPGVLLALAVGGQRSGDRTLADCEPDAEGLVD